jgi:RNase H-fold protein (predicted Holliday junction resolvase)
MLATKLSSALVAPSKVANILDWRKAVGAVMALDITRDRIGMAIAEHPENICESVPLNSIMLQKNHTQEDGATKKTFKRSRVDKELISELEAAVRQHRVCAFVVNWPIHEGRMGEQCGKVLQVLDSVIDQSNSVVTRKRPFTLWCNYANASFETCPPDEWGRSSDFARDPPTFHPDMKYSSKTATDRPSEENASVVAAGILDEWMKNHWEIDNKIGRATKPKKTTGEKFFFSAHSVDEYNNEKACLQAALL